MAGNGISDVDIDVTMEEESGGAGASSVRTSIQPQSGGVAAPVPPSASSTTATNNSSTEKAGRRMAGGPREPGEDEEDDDDEKWNFKWNEPAPRSGLRGMLVRCAWKTYKGCEWLGEKIADAMGLNDSRYQWVIDAYMLEKEQEAKRIADQREQEAIAAEALEAGHPTATAAAEAMTPGLVLDAYEGAARQQKKADGLTV